MLSVGHEKTEFAIDKELSLGILPPFKFRAVRRFSVDLQRWDRAKELVGSTFELTTLIQKRCRELVKGRQRKLVDLESRNPIQIALEEVLQGKIHLAPPPPPEVLSAAAEGAASVGPDTSTGTVEVKID